MIIGTILFLCLVFFMPIFFIFGIYFALGILIGAIKVTLVIFIAWIIWKIFLEELLK